MNETKITDDQKVRASSLHAMFDEYKDYNPSESEANATPEVGDDMPVAMFVLQGRFGQAMSLVEQALLDANTSARLVTEVDPKDNKLWLYVDTDSGIHVKIDALPLSVPFGAPVYVNIYDLCNAVHKLMSTRESNVALWVSEGKLYMGAFFNDKIGGFELEIGFEQKDAFEVKPVSDDGFSIRLGMDQITFNTILDSVYNFDTVEIHRKNGRVSYRTGNDHCTIATAMQNTVMVSDLTESSKFDNTSDFSISVPSKIFKVIPLVNALDMDLSLTVLIDIDTVHKQIRISGVYATLVADYGDSTLQTYNNDGMERVFHIKAESISAAIGMYFDMNYINPTGKVRIYGIENGLIGIEGLDDERIHVNLTVGDCIVEHPGFEIELPLDVLTMMIRNSGCPDLVLQHGFENGRTMMTYGNGMFLRKCTYIA
jgi:hypothetical protein